MYGELCRCDIQGEYLRWPHSFLRHILRNDQVMFLSKNSPTIWIVHKVEEEDDRERLHQARQNPKKEDGEDAVDEKNNHINECKVRDIENYVEFFAGKKIYKRPLIKGKFS